MGKFSTKRLNFWKKLRISALNSVAPTHTPSGHSKRFLPQFEFVSFFFPCRTFRFPEENINLIFFAVAKKMHPYREKVIDVHEYRGKTGFWSLLLLFFFATFEQHPLSVVTSCIGSSLAPGSSKFFELSLHFFRVRICAKLAKSRK